MLLDESQYDGPPPFLEGAREMSDRIPDENLIRMVRLEYSGTGSLVNELCDRLEQRNLEISELKNAGQKLADYLKEQGK